ncbi:amidohydrolase family protein [Aquimarina litoralis]|uniref:amidohydrolase family protein n=1 Tax=Aquimarina litoralis TaxID=584605 RepID=UPI001C5825E9|nr:amidohydrolase family protein [Aquimarina litoralis]MBW1298435.1 amidohydrolase family protein [Aquimarina litoralis]
MKTNVYYTLIVLFFLVSCQSKENTDKKESYINPKSLTMELKNGNWFNGNTFEKKTAWVRNGILSFENKNELNDTIINLKGKYVIPPFAEAHNHNLESAFQLEKRINSYLKNGVFYVKQLSSIKKQIDPLMHHYNKPNGIDISMAHAPLTATGGHPVALREWFLESGWFEGLFDTLDDIESHGFFTIDNQNDLENKWSHILSFKPDFIKIMLLHSEEYEKRKNDTTFFGKKGLNPALVPIIVKKAHENNLRVSAHVETAHDFHVAVKSGVDEIAHFPEIFNGNIVPREDVVLARKKNTVVTTTISLINRKKEDSLYTDLLDNIKQNLKIFKEEKVTLAIGSDMFNDNSVGEFQLLYDLNIFSNLELLKMWVENAAKTTLPNRNIGHLQEGFEASFLVLDSDPLADIREINNSIVLKVKQGEILE